MRDIEIRKILKETRLTSFFNDGNSKIVEEFSFPTTKSRIDMAVINCSLHGYEIKSSLDTLQRLPNQLMGYSKILDFLYVVTEPKHFSHVEKMVPDWVGLMVCEKYEQQTILTDVKPSTKNPNKEGFHIAKLLWRDEIIDVLTQSKVDFKKKDRNWILCEVMAANLELEFISQIVRDKLKQRPGWKLHQ